MGNTYKNLTEMTGECYDYLLKAGWKAAEIDAELVENQIFQLHNIQLDRAFVQQQLIILNAREGGTIATVAAVEALQNIIKWAEQDELEDNETFALLVKHVTNGLKQHVKEVTGFEI